MRTRKISDLNEYHRLLENPENLIGIAFFVKELDQVILLGDLAGCGVVAQADNLWEAIEAFDSIARMNESEVSEQFGEHIVQLPLTDDELLAKTAAVESLRESLAGRAGIRDVRATATSIAVIIEEEGQYDGPWEWEGFPVYAEAEV